MSLNELCEVMPHFILQELNLAKDLKMKLGEEQVQLMLFDSLYKNLYSSRNNLKSVTVLGCPIASAVACAIAKSSGRTIFIQKQQVSPDGLVIQLWYRMVKG